MPLLTPAQGKMKLREGCVFEYRREKNRTLLILKKDEKYGCEGVIAIKTKDDWKVLDGKQIIFNAWKKWAEKTIEKRRMNNDNIYYNRNAKGKQKSCMDSR